MGGTNQEAESDGMTREAVIVRLRERASRIEAWYEDVEVGSGTAPIKYKSKNNWLATLKRAAELLEEDDPEEATYQLGYEDGKGAAKPSPGGLLTDDERESLEYTKSTMLDRRAHYNRRLGQGPCDGSGEWKWANVERDRSHEAVQVIRSILDRDAQAREADTVTIGREAITVLTRHALGYGGISRGSLEAASSTARDLLWQTGRNTAPTTEEEDD